MKMLVFLWLLLAPIALQAGTVLPGSYAEMTTGISIFDLTTDEGIQFAGIWWGIGLTVGIGPWDVNEPFNASFGPTGSDLYPQYISPESPYFLGSDSSGYLYFLFDPFLPSVGVFSVPFTLDGGYGGRISEDVAHILLTFVGQGTASFTFIPDENGDTQYVELRHVLFEFEIQPVPEPGTWVLLLLGLGASRRLARSRAGNRKQTVRTAF